MNKDYKKRLTAHRKKLIKKLIPVSVLPLIIIILLTTVFLLRDTPNEWKNATITISSIENTTVYSGNTGSKTVAEIIDSTGKRFVLSQMKPDEARELLKLGKEYKISYSKDLFRLHIESICDNDNVIVNRESSVQIYSSNRTATISVCAAFFIAMLVAFAVVIQLYCKEEIKNIKHIKHKLKTLSPSPSPAGKGDQACLVDEESNIKPKL